MKYKVEDIVEVADRKMKTHGFSGRVLSIETTLENKNIYMIELDVLNMEQKPTGKKKVVNLLEEQLIRGFKPKEKSNVSL